MREGLTVEVSAADRARLRAIVADRNSPQKHVRRAAIVLATAEGCGTAEITRRAGVSKPCVWRWQARFMAEGVAGLPRDKTRPPGTPPLPSATVERVVELTRRAPPGEVTHRTGRAMAEAVGISLSAVQGIWKAHGLAARRVRTFKLSRDPEFIAKLRDVVGLYVHPPAHAVVLSVDEESQIQALERTRPGLPMREGRCATATHDYARHGTTTLFAALDVLDGTVPVPLHAAAPAPGVPALPERRGSCRAGRHAGARDPRRLRHPQAPQGPGLAGAAPALDLPLHADLGLVAQRRRGLFRQADSAAAAARQLPFVGGPAGGDQPLRRGGEQGPPALRLDRRAGRHHREGATRVPSVPVSPLAILPRTKCLILCGTTFNQPAVV